MRPSPNGFWLPVCIAKVIAIFNHRVALMQRWLMKGLSRVMGNYPARFLGGLGPVMAPGYPVLKFIPPKTETYKEFIKRKGAEFKQGKPIKMKDIGRKGRHFWQREAWTFMRQLI
jgi:hypothetical protein